MQTDGGYSQVCGTCVSSTHGQEYLLPIGEGTNGHALSFSWLLIRIELLAFLTQTVVAYCRHADSSTGYVGQRYPDQFGVVAGISCPGCHATAFVGLLHR